MFRELLPLTTHTPLIKGVWVVRVPKKFAEPFLYLWVLVVFGPLKKLAWLQASEYAREFANEVLLDDQFAVDGLVLA